MVNLINIVKVIGISGISGAGKTSLTRKLSSEFSATAVYWDDFDEISSGPDDYVEWYHTNGDYNAWKYPALAEVLRKLKANEAVLSPATQEHLLPSDFIFFDAPLGRAHVATGQYIDYLIHLETPLDIALARRLVRDFRESSHLPAKAILDELQFYLQSSRPLFCLSDRERKMWKADLVLNGDLPQEEMVKLIRKNLMALPVEKLWKVFKKGL